jgi:DMSO/TMAO reductase YedYZ molybdopterin-dependent catalytic subunit
MARRPALALLAVLLLAGCLAVSLCGCGEEEKASPFLESEKRLEGMYEECKTIEVSDAAGEHPDIDTEAIKSLEMVDVNTVLVRSNGMEKEGVWSGVRFSDVLRNIGVAEPFTELRMEAWDGYIAKIPYEMSMRADTILAWEEDGSPLPEEQGPVRLVVGSEDGFYWIQRITRIEVVR